MCWDVKYILLIIFITLVSYVSALLIERVAPLKKKLVVIISIVVYLSVLFFFIYCNFMTTSVTRALLGFGISIASVTTSFLLPVGISLYTFQAIGYIIDVWGV